MVESPSELVSSPLGNTETTLVKYSLDGKEASLVKISFDDSCHLLWITSEKDQVSLDLLQLRVGL